MKFKLVESFLMEDIEAVKKNYPQIQDEKFNELIKLDPTYKENSNNIGVYGKWILNLYNKKNVRDEDLYKIPNLLNQFNEKKKWMINKDIGQFKTLPELSKALDDVQEGELTQRQKVRRNQNAKHKSDLNKDAELFYEDDSWEVWIPKTYAASCKLGSGTEWCTASTSDDSRYYGYRDEQGGFYYVFIDKNDISNKYQLHLPSNQFMDKHDGSIWNKNDLSVMQLYKQLESKLKDKDDSIKLSHEKYIDKYGRCAWVVFVLRSDWYYSYVPCNNIGNPDIYDEMEISNVSNFKWDNIVNGKNITVFEQAKQLISRRNEFEKKIYNQSNCLNPYSYYGSVYYLLQDLNIAYQIDCHSNEPIFQSVAMDSPGACKTESEAKSIVKYLQDGLLKLGYSQKQVDDVCYQYCSYIDENVEVHFEDYLKDS